VKDEGKRRQEAIESLKRLDNKILPDPLEKVVFSCLLLLFNAFLSFLLFPAALPYVYFLRLTAPVPIIIFHLFTLHGGHDWTSFPSSPIFPNFCWAKHKRKSKHSCSSRGRPYVVFSFGIVKLGRKENKIGSLENKPFPPTASFQQLNWERNKLIISTSPILLFWLRILWADLFRSSCGGEMRNWDHSRRLSLSGRRGGEEEDKIEKLVLGIPFLILQI